MRFVLGPIPPSRTLDAEAAGWTPLSSVPARWAAAQAALGLVPCLVAAALALQRAADGLTPGPFLVVLLFPAILIPAHEVVHALGYLVGLRSPHLVTGIWLRHGIWYVVHDAPLPRRRVLLMLAAPFLVLSVLPATAAVLMTGPWRWAVAYLVLMHAALCVGDLLTFVRVARQVPAGGWVHNREWVTYWSRSWCPSPRNRPAADSEAP